MDIFGVKVGNLLFLGGNWYQVPGGELLLGADRERRYVESETKLFFHLPCWAGHACTSPATKGWYERNFIGNVRKGKKTEAGRILRDARKARDDWPITLTAEEGADLGLCEVLPNSRLRSVFEEYFGGSDTYDRTSIAEFFK